MLLQRISPSGLLPPAKTTGSQPTNHFMAPRRPTTQSLCSCVLKSRSATPSTQDRTVKATMSWDTMSSKTFATEALCDETGTGPASRISSKFGE
uniref:Uncharacterized protein n=1 Tax=Ditylenchus dipsaci TaxID=166011 RepID=A0A915CVL4_9BILA